VNLQFGKFSTTVTEFTQDILGQLDVTELRQRQREEEKRKKKERRREGKKKTLNYQAVSQK
jgi:hypothetical protein